MVMRDRSAGRELGTALPSEAASAQIVSDSNLSVGMC